MHDESDWRKPGSWQRRFWGDQVDDPQFRAKAAGGLNERTSTPMPKQQYSLTVANQAAQFEATLKASGIDLRLHEGLWDIWADNPTKADQLVARYKAAGALPVKTKQAPGMTTIEVPAELASEIAACRAQWGDAPLAQVLRQARGGQATGGAALTDDEKAATLKAGGLTPVQQAARQTLPSLYVTKGTKR